MKKIISSMLLLVMGTGVYACDMCGCAAGSQYLGILPQYYKHFIGVQYQYSSFVASQPSLTDRSEYEHAYEYNNTLQLFGRYNVSKRLQLFAFMPYHMNAGMDADTRINTTGIGDMTLLANVAVVKHDSDRYAWKQLLLAGGGVKLPTGKYTGITTLDDQGLPNTQAGTGSYDAIANINYTVRHMQAGINIDASYTMTTANASKYKYGNHLNSSLLAFYWLQKGKLAIMPQAGVRYEYSLHDYDNYERKWLNETSGGSLTFATAGAQCYYKQYGLKATYNIPIAQNYSGGYVTTGPRLETSLFFLF